MAASVPAADYEALQVKQLVCPSITVRHEGVCCTAPSMPIARHAGRMSQQHITITKGRKRLPMTSAVCLLGPACIGCRQGMMNQTGGALRSKKLVQDWGGTGQQQAWVQACIPPNRPFLCALLLPHNLTGLQARHAELQCWHWEGEGGGTVHYEKWKFYQNSSKARVSALQNLQMQYGACRLGSRLALRPLSHAERPMSLPR